MVVCWACLGVVNKQNKFSFLASSPLPSPPLLSPLSDDCHVGVKPYAARTLMPLETSLEL